MKKLLFVLLFSFFFVRCEKENDNCWTCKIETTFTFPLQSLPRQIIAIAYCTFPDSMTADFILNYEMNNSYRTYSDTLKVVQTVNCYK